MEALPRSLDLDFRNPSKFEFAPDRNRNDSGCFDDFDFGSASGGSSPHDPVVTYWDEAINQWSERARAVIAQEVVRMNEQTRKSKRELLKFEDREKVHKAWKQNMRDTMDLALDLIKCVSYDVLEEFGFEPAPSEDYRKTEKHLTRIAEEESADEGGHKSSHKGGHTNRVVIIRVDHRIRRVPLKRRGVSRSPFAKSPSKVNKNKLSKNTMSMMLEELKELRRMVGMKKTSDSPRELWGCKQCLSNPTSWKEPRGIVQEEVEDIFSDWVRMLHKSDIRINADINDVFWNISCDKDMVRTRRLSEVIDEMPFEDRPDIFQDRCEILESDAKFSKKRPVVKGYWNIFSEWRHNLKEPAKPFSDWEILERKKNAQNLSKKKMRNREIVLDQEDYFEDWRHNLVPKKRPQKRRRALELEDVMTIWGNIFDEKPKSRGRKRKAKKTPEPEDFFEDWRENLEVKSKRQLKRESRYLAQEDYFEDFRKSFLDRNPKHPKVPRSRPVKEDFFEDICSNLKVKSKRDLRKLYQDDYWRQVFLDPTQKSQKVKSSNNNLEQEDFFMNWRKNLDPTGLSKSYDGSSATKWVFSPEDIFEEWRPLLLDREGRHRRRSIDELEDEEAVIISSPFKKLKHDFQAKKRAGGKSSAYKFGRVYQGMKRNFLISVGSSAKIEDNFDFWSSESTVQSLMDSRKEFCQLRFAMRQQRQINRDINAVIAPEAWFEDWRWNLDDDMVLAKRRASEPVMASPEMTFSVWRRTSFYVHQPSPTDTFSRWMKNLKDRVKRRNSKSHPSQAAASSEVKTKLSSSPPPTSSSFRMGGVVSLPHFSNLLFRSKSSKEAKSLKHPQTGKASSEKHSMRLMAKCHAKQPFGRGRN